MGIIAKGEITLSPVNDAYTVLVTPASCVINADFNGDNPRLESASGTISVKRGAMDVPFTASLGTCSSPEIEISISGSHFKVDRISNKDLSGWIDFLIETHDGFSYIATCRWTFAVVRESTMLDWIQDWEGGKTKIGGSYIMTPKMFVGRKEDVVEYVNEPGEETLVPIWKPDALTGVYIGPDLLASNENGVGLYGYFRGSEIFHLSADGGMIGGWDIASGGIQSPDGKLSLLSEGTIISQDQSLVHWSLNADGNATFANGNVSFLPNGDASFNGTITANSGSIGGWSIGHMGLFSGSLLLDAASRYIGIAANSNWNVPQTGGVIATTATLHKESVSKNGGISLFWNSGADYGMIVHSVSERIAQLGSTNQIAGWTITADSFYIGTKNNTQGSFATDGMTIGTNGLRGKTWNIDANGHASFANNKVVFNADGTASISGWLLSQTRLSSDHVALVSNSVGGGLFVSPSDISNVGDMVLRSALHNQGGIYICTDGTDTLMKSIAKDGSICLSLSTDGVNMIGLWSFDKDSLYNGNKEVGTDGFMGQDSILMSIYGLRGHKWKLLSDGSGAIAGGNIRWAADGTVTFADSVSLNWSNVSGAMGNRLTQIDANGVYTGTVSADNVSAGTLVGSSVRSSNSKWEINDEGDGHLASGNIAWDADGNVNFNGDISIHTLRYFIEPEDPANGKYNGGGEIVNDSFRIARLGGEHFYTLPHLQPNEYRTIKLLVMLVSATNGDVVLSTENSEDYIIRGTDWVNAPHVNELSLHALYGEGLGYYELVGIGRGNVTFWCAIKIGE